MKIQLLAVLLVFGLSFSLLPDVAIAGLDEGLAAYRKADYATALRELKPLAIQGNSASQLVIGGMYANGQGVPQDYKEAAKWYRLATDLDNESIVVADSINTNAPKKVQNQLPNFNVYIIEAGGLNLPIVISDDFVDARQELPAFFSALQRVQSGNTKLTAYFVGRKAVSTFKKGGSQGVTPYITIRYPLVNLRGVASQKDFDQLRFDMRPIISKIGAILSDSRLKEYLLDLSKTIEKETNSQLRFSLQKPVLISIDADTPDRFIYTLLSNTNVTTAAGAVSTTMVTTTALIFTHGKVLQFSLFNEFSNPGVVEANRNTLKTLISQTLK